MLEGKEVGGAVKDLRTGEKVTKDEVQSHTGLLCGSDPSLGENVKKTRPDRQQVLWKAEGALRGQRSYHLVRRASEGGDIGRGRSI